MNFNIDKSAWEKVKLGDVAFEYSKRINNPSESDFDRFIGSSNISQWDFRVKSWEPTDSVTSAMKLFEPNDYLLVRRSLYASDFRERAPRAHFSGVCSGDIITIKENPELISDGFLIGVLNSPALWKYVVANASGSITRRIKWKDLCNYEFPLPPLDQQTELAKLFWALDEEVEKKSLNEKCLEILKKSLLKNKVADMRSATTEKLKLDKLIKIKHGFPFKSEYWAEDDSVLPIAVAIGNYDYEGGFRFQRTKIKCYSGNYPREYELSSDDLLLAMTCQTPGGEILGIPGFVPDDGRTYLHNQRIGKVELESEERVLGGYLYLVFLTETFRKFVFSSASGTKVLHTSPTKILEYVIDLPSLSYQHSIVKEVEKVLMSMRMLAENINASKALKKSLINQVF